MDDYSKRYLTEVHMLVRRWCKLEMYANQGSIHDSSRNVRAALKRTPV